MTDEFPRKITQKVKMLDLWFLLFACCLMIIDIYIKFREDFLNGYQVIERACFYDRQSSKGND